MIQSKLSCFPVIKIYLPLSLSILNDILSMVQCKVDNVCINVGVYVDWKGFKRVSWKGFHAQNLFQKFRAEQR